MYVQVSTKSLVGAGHTEGMSSSEVAADIVTALAAAVVAAAAEIASLTSVPGPAVPFISWILEMLEGWIGA